MIFLRQLKEKNYKRNERKIQGVYAVSNHMSFSGDSIHSIYVDK